MLVNLLCSDMYGVFWREEVLRACWEIEGWLSSSGMTAAVTNSPAISLHDGKQLWEALAAKRYVKRRCLSWLSCKPYLCPRVFTARKPSLSVTFEGGKDVETCDCGASVKISKSKALLTAVIRQ